MKSYSDNIPNVSTEELQRTAQVTDETNNLVNDNLKEIKRTAKLVTTNINLMKVNIVLSLLTLSSVAGVIIYNFLTR
jgi:hypothetical protein